MCAHERAVEQPSALLMRGGLLGITQTLPLCGSADAFSRRLVPFCGPARLDCRGLFACCHLPRRKLGGHACNIRPSLPSEIWSLHHGQIAGFLALKIVPA